MTRSIVIDDGYTSFTITVDKSLVPSQYSISVVPLDKLETEERGIWARYSTGGQGVLLLMMDKHHSPLHSISH